MSSFSKDSWRDTVERYVAVKAFSILAKLGHTRGGSLTGAIRRVSRKGLRRDCEVLVVGGECLRQGCEVLVIGGRLATKL